MGSVEHRSGPSFFMWTSAASHRLLLSAPAGVARRAARERRRRRPCSSSCSRPRAARAVLRPTRSSPSSCASSRSPTSRSSRSRCTWTTGTTRAGRIRSRRRSSPAARRRTRRSFGAKPIYTPQMVVDGRDELNGSDEPAARRAVQAAAARPHLPLRIDARAAGASVRLSIDLPAAPLPPTAEPIDVLVALTEDDLSSVVRRGENGGRTLTHVAVVRKLESLGIARARGLRGRRSVEPRSDLEGGEDARRRLAPGAPHPARLRRGDRGAATMTARA